MSATFEFEDREHSDTFEKAKAEPLIWSDFEEEKYDYLMFNLGDFGRLNTVKNFQCNLEIKPFPF